MDDDPGCVAAPVDLRDQIEDLVCQCEEQVDLHCHDEHKKPHVILSSNAVVDPWAVVIINHDARLTDLTMPRTQRFDNLHLEMDYLTVETNIDWVIFGHDTEQLFCRLFIAL